MARSHGAPEPELDAATPERWGPLLDKALAALNAREINRGYRLYLDGPAQLEDGWAGPRGAGLDMNAIIIGHAYRRPREPRHRPWHRSPYHDPVTVACGDSHVPFIGDRTPSRARLPAACTTCWPACHQPYLESASTVAH